MTAPEIDYDDNGYPDDPMMDAYQNRGNIHQTIDRSRINNDALPWIVAVVLTITSVVAIAMASLADGKADRAMDAARAMDSSVAERQRLTERETRIMQDDLKYVRSYLSARGISIPANHEEAEENPK